MTPCRTIEIRTPVRIVLIAGALTGGLGLGAAAQTEASNDALLQPTPLILKDGRIANVSVHTLAFAQGQSALGPASTQRLGSLTREMATDCFLTAQVIGHVGTAEVGNDTLNAHRLARARADAVQAALIAGGLPAKAIASVWDWQFMVREARATLWVFRLTRGEDCDGKPLDSGAPALVADAEAPLAPASAGGPRADQMAAAVPAHEPAPTAWAPPERPPASMGVAQAAEPPPASVAAVPAGPSRAQAGVPSVIQALPAVSPSTTKVPDRTPEPSPSAPVIAARPAPPPLPEVVAALPERVAPAPVEAAPAGRQAALEAGPEPVVIIFPTNSSYFPPGTSAELTSLLQQLGGDGRYEVVLQASVSGSEKVVGAETPEEAAQYNSWLAERRVERIRDWLDQNLEGRTVAIKPEYRAADESRRVVVRVVPTG